MDNIDEIRLQFEALNRKLQDQTIITRKLLDGAMRGRLAVVRLRYSISIACGLYVLAIGLRIFSHAGFSNAFVGCTAVFMAGCIFVTLYLGRNVLTGSILRGSMLDVANKVAANMRRERLWFRCGVGLTLLWGAWLSVEAWLLNDNYFAVALLTGLAIGLVISYLMYHKIMSSYASMIGYIEEIKSESTGV